MKMMSSPPTISDSTRELSVVCRLLMAAWPKPLLTNRLIKCSMVRDCGIREICPCISDVGRMAMATSQ